MVVFYYVRHLLVYLPFNLVGKWCRLSHIVVRVAAFQDHCLVTSSSLLNPLLRVTRGAKWDFSRNSICTRWKSLRCQA